MYFIILYCIKISNLWFYWNHFSPKLNFLSYETSTFQESSTISKSLHLISTQSYFFSDMKETHWCKFTHGRYVDAQIKRTPAVLPAFIKHTRDPISAEPCVSPDPLMNNTLSSAHPCGQSHFRPLLASWPSSSHRRLSHSHSIKYSCCAKESDSTLLHPVSRASSLSRLFLCVCVCVCLGFMVSAEGLAGTPCLTWAFSRDCNL